MTLVREFGCTNLYANIEYEVDELRRDIKLCELSKDQGVCPTFVHNKCIVEPGVIVTKDKKYYAVYSPYQRNWLTVLNNNIPYYLEDCPKPHPNPASIHDSKKFAPLFETPVPDSLEGFELTEEGSKKMRDIWPAGEDVAAEV
ncbi:hypothetical protein H0H81_004913 [Sphagnurus paluster]|uniref:Photolyase/cryptochrome alpha/beta domain-containing protein n=1 Tax=Sphagnurus paluster TaxID=117069 RepID=A0A9P7G2D3_9AGAR|nr:hypothetical protein H0H81_004913 [Sphagnurus paluster]